MIKKYQKGVSLIITFFILTIILAVVLSISAILYSEIKIIRNIGNSVVSFYAADSGVEKILYYDRKVVPDEGTRGLCSVCNSCPTDNTDTSINCANCLLSGEKCNFDDCTDCQIDFSTTLASNKSYVIEAVVSPNGENTDFTIDATGSYEDVKRAIRLIITKNEPQQAIIIRNGCAIPRSEEEYFSLLISVDVKASNQVSRVYAYVQKPDGNDVGSPLQLNLYEGSIYDGTYTGTWSGSQGAYYVDIHAYDMLDQEAIKNNIQCGVY